MRVTVKKWGNSAAVRIPAAIMEAAQIAPDAVVDVSEEDGRIVIVPLRNEAFDLDSLVSKMTPDNLHDEADFGPPVGRELL
ncbi:MAG TPA: AbrB/MazE/SpoVT family DNA-binding domain-containing protein [Pseudorhizobium sp.]|nr:AbrB/MazE/SpoVT family DNA-binding domain-containing protein [Pseudorhizobium sp.]